MFKRILTISILTFSLSSHSAIVNLGGTTFDTATGLEWLDVTATIGLSYNQVSAQLGAGGTWQGWRYATYSELDQLIAGFGYSPVITPCSLGQVYCDNSLPGDNNLIETMIQTLGDTYYQYLVDENLLGYYDLQAGGAGYTYGILGSTAGSAGYPGYRDIGMILDQQDYYVPSGNPGDRPDIVASIWTAQQETASDPFIGSYLVRTSAIPVPAAIWLFGSGLVALGWVRRKQAV
ncbi:PEP-CTERM sorting domain-containing protein [Oceanicoccus sp. KOV_DT_Chl]|uniref:PEP-CTERM sorting domain-containing protein n=1 Tax=Oceanicoccus sp. KOV_DT_Chl TaxID=1904639 RepID=UPI0011AF93CC|nr:PEP-CTERM sorting domain-containing protein [Oceanicoccus sp. KOV_DT_Chl]